MRLRSYKVKGDSRSAIVKKNIIASFAIKGISIVVSLLLVPMTLGYVSSELYGIWLTLSSVVMWLSFFDVGFTLGMRNKLAEAIAKNDFERGKMLVSTTYVVMSVLFGVLCLLLELAIPYVDWTGFLNVDSQYNEDIMMTMQVLTVFFSLQMIVNVFTSVLSGFQKVALSSAFPVIGNAISLVLIFVLTKCVAPSLVALAFAISGVPVFVILIASLLMFNKDLKKVSPSLKHFNRDCISDVFGLGAKFFLIQIQVLVMYQSTNILISNVSSAEAVTEYNIAYKYLGTALMAFNIVLSPLWPAFTDAYTKLDFVWMKNVYAKMIRLFALSVGLLVLMLLSSPIVYEIWIGNKTSVSFTMSFFVFLYIAVWNWMNMHTILINGVGTVKLQTHVTFVGMFVHIPLSLFLGGVLHWGAISVLVSMITISAAYSLVFYIQMHKILSQKATGIWAE